MEIALIAGNASLSRFTAKECSVAGAEFSKTVNNLSRAVHSALTDLIPRHAYVAHVDHPSHTNVGDHAIWLGERQTLRRLQVRRTYVCSVDTYDRKHMAEVIGDGLILIQGG